MLYAITKAIGRIILRVIFRIRVHGLDEFPKEGTFILASNHLSNIDPYVLGMMCPQRLYFLAKQELFANKVAAWYFTKMGAFPLRRTTSDVNAIRTALRILAQRKSLVIFPQGTRDATFTSVKPGVGFLIKKTNVPVMLAKIKGTDKVLPPGVRIPQVRNLEITFKRLDLPLCANLSREAISQKILDKIKVL